jgi:hypothetical protein
VGRYVLRVVLVDPGGDDHIAGDTQSDVKPGVITAAIKHYHPDPPVPRIDSSVDICGILMLSTVGGGLAMKLRCLLRGHTWGPLEGLGQATVHTCTYCGKRKQLVPIRSVWKGV